MYYLLSFSYCKAVTHCPLFQPVLTLFTVTVQQLRPISLYRIYVRQWVLLCHLCRCDCVWFSDGILSRGHPVLTSHTLRYSHPSGITSHCTATLADSGFKRHYITCMDGHTWEAITDTHKDRRAHVTTWQSPRYPPLTQYTQSLTRTLTHTHTQSMAGVTFISALKQVDLWECSFTVARLQVCVCVSYRTQRADWDSTSCMIKHSLYTHTQADKVRL